MQRDPVAQADPQIMGSCLSRGRNGYNREADIFGSSMIDIGWITFVLKLLLVPTFIAVVSLAGRRWGTTVSG
ncbi:MAG TPA: hypothetical protein VED86_04495, partial [archaeon]|nr:hypothetical protein [archaeon]